MRFAKILVPNWLKHSSFFPFFIFLFFLFCGWLGGFQLVRTVAVTPHNFKRKNHQQDVINMVNSEGLGVRLKNRSYWKTKDLIGGLVKYIELITHKTIYRS